MKKKEYLMKELERLRKQQGEFTQRLHVKVTCGAIGSAFM